MLNLAIECSGVAGSVALYHHRELLAERWLPPEVGSVQTLAATIDKLLSQFVASAPRQVDLISVTCGPGSFTGLRVGLATAQMLAFAWKIPVAPVDTLAAIAWRVAQDGCRQNRDQAHNQASPTPIILIPVLNAFRKQVFTGGWLIDGQSDRGGEQASQDGEWNQSQSPPWPVLTRVAPSQVLDATAWQAQPWESLRRNELVLPVNVMVSGPGLRNYMPSPLGHVALAEPSLWEPTASAVAQLGWLASQQGRVVAAGELRPNYVRASAAEELIR